MKQQRRAPNPLRKWARVREALYVLSSGTATFTIVPLRGDSTGGYAMLRADLDWLEHDIERVLSKALRAAKE